MIFLRCSDYWYSCFKSPSVSSAVFLGEDVNDRRRIPYPLLHGKCDVNNWLMFLWYPRISFFRSVLSHGKNLEDDPRTHNRRLPPNQMHQLSQTPPTPKNQRDCQEIIFAFTELVSVGRPSAFGTECLCNFRKKDGFFCYLSWTCIVMFGCSPRVTFDLCALLFIDHTIRRKDHGASARTTSKI